VEVEEIIPYDCPTAKGHPVVITTYVDANLCHDMLTERAVTGVLHLVNQTILDYYTKKQPKVESATYGSEFMAGQTATEQIMDLLQSVLISKLKSEGGIVFILHDISFESVARFMLSNIVLFLRCSS
jgi:hypothetical protein